MLRGDELNSRDSERETCPLCSRGKLSATWKPLFRACSLYRLLLVLFRGYLCEKNSAGVVSRDGLSSVRAWIVNQRERTGENGILLVWKNFRFQRWKIRRGEDDPFWENNYNCKNRTSRLWKRLRFLSDGHGTLHTSINRVRIVTERFSWYHCLIVSYSIN